MVIPTAEANHIDQPQRTIWEVFEQERSQLVAYPGRFDGFHAAQVLIGKTCLVRFDNNKYSVLLTAVGRPAEIHTYLPFAQAGARFSSTCTMRPTSTTC